MAANKLIMPEAEARHSIAVVSRRTGVSQLVLRAWERRYCAVSPGRTPTGRRLYTDRDVEKISLLQQLTSVGYRIGDIANQGLSELRNLVAENPGVATTATTAQMSPGTADEYLATALDSVARLDTQDLNQILEKALVDLSKPDLRNKLIVPLLNEIGLRWSDGRMRICHEHLTTSIVSTFLAGMNTRQPVRASAPLVVVATPIGQLHELGALLAASAVLEQGGDVLYLGRDLPAEDLASAVRTRGARGVLLSLVFPLGDASVMKELRQLRQLVGPDLPIVVGGRATPSYGVVLAEIGARIVRDDDDLKGAIADL